MSNRTAFERLIEKYADGRPICNCGEAYYKPCGHGIKNGIERTDMLACEYGCSSNQIYAKEYIAERVERELSARPEVGERLPAIWLRREGGESDVGRVVVLVEVDGKWHEVIREVEGCSFSHIVEPLGIKSKVAGTNTV